MDMIKNVLDNERNVSVTENGALGFSTSGKELLDINFAVSSLRSCPEIEVVKRFARVFHEDKTLAVKWLFFAGDVRGGMGERRLFRLGMAYLAYSEPELAKKLIPLIPEYTRWDNVVTLLSTPVEKDAISLIREQLNADLKAMRANKPVSLLAKWLPSLNATSKETVEYAKYLCRALGMTNKQYRTALSSLRKYLKVVEVQMSADEWSEINYSAVPSRANLIYGKAFFKHDEDRRIAYLESVSRGEQKINSGVLFPHDIVHSYSYGDYSLTVKELDQTLEELWRALPDYVDGDDSTMCVVDGSSSMTVRVGNTRVKAMEVAFALGIYFAERCNDRYKDKFITFSERPRYIDLSKQKTLHDKLAKAFAYSEVANTNIEAVFDLILNTAVKNKLNQADLPRNVLILSDMEFDNCAVVGKTKGKVYLTANNADGVRLFEELGARYEEKGYKLPRLVFWNINSRTLTVPVRENELGVALVSGFSPTIASMVLSGDLDPYKCLLAQLSTPRYDKVEIAIK